MEQCFTWFWCSQRKLFHSLDRRLGLPRGWRLPIGRQHRRRLSHIPRWKKDPRRFRAPWHAHHDHSRASRSGPRLSHSNGVLSHLVGSHGAAPLAAAESDARSGECRAQGRRRHRRSGYHGAIRRRRKRFERPWFFRRRSPGPQSSPSSARTFGSSRSDRQASDRGAHKRQRSGRELGATPCGRHRRGLVSR